MRTLDHSMKCHEQDHVLDITLNILLVLVNIYGDICLCLSRPTWTHCIAVICGPCGYLIRHILQSLCDMTFSALVSESHSRLVLKKSISHETLYKIQIYLPRDYLSSLYFSLNGCDWKLPFLIQLHGLNSHVWKPVSYTRR